MRGITSLGTWTLGLSQFPDLTIVKIRNKETGEELYVTAEEFRSILREKSSIVDWSG